MASMRSQGLLTTRSSTNSIAWVAGARWNHGATPTGDMRLKVAVHLVSPDADHPIPDLSRVYSRADRLVATVLR